MTTLPTDLKQADLEELASAGLESLTEIAQDIPEEVTACRTQFALLESILTEIHERETAKYRGAT